jgi:hypothetical protein
MPSTITRRVVHAIAILAALLSLCVFFSGSAVAQCAMCKASLGGNSLFAKYLNIGVLVLLVPPISIFCTIFILAFRHRRSG